MVTCARQYVVMAQYKLMYPTNMSTSKNKQNLKIYPVTYLKIVLVLAKLRMAPRTIPIPRSSDAFNCKKTGRPQHKHYQTIIYRNQPKETKCTDWFKNCVLHNSIETRKLHELLARAANDGASKFHNRCRIFLKKNRKHVLHVSIYLLKHL